MFRLSSFFCIFCLISTLKTYSQDKLDIEILFESLCPDSLSFITQQLHPVYKELSPYINLKLTPFGKSAYTGGGQFICQHGPPECKGNKIMSCALNQLSDQNSQVEYINCFMKIFMRGRKNENEYGQTCSDIVGIDFKEINKCYSSEIGLNLQLLAEKDTLKVKPRFVPTILYNGIFDQKLQDDSLVDFRAVVYRILSQT